MGDYDERLARCAMCSSDRLVAYDRDYRGNHIYACQDCGVKFMNPQYSDGYMAELYSGYSLREREGTIPHRCRSDVRSEGKRRTLRLLEQFVEPGRVLMIGCGDGLELDIAQQNGWTVEGYDVDEESADRIRSRTGIEIHHGAFEHLSLAQNSFDAVFMDQVIEHPKQPTVYLEGVRRLLRPGGVLFLGTPNIGSWSNRAKTMLGKLGLRERRRGKHYATQHHLFYFTPTVLKRLMERFAYEVVVVRGTLKPQTKPLTSFLNRWFPSLDSSFILVARKPA